jgi:microcompartment protein CcmL/EutN
LRIAIVGSPFLEEKNPRTINVTDFLYKGSSRMPAAVGTIETVGFPAVLAAADAMVKAGAVTLVYYGLAERGNFIVAVRGKIAEVKVAVAAGIEAAEKVYGGEVVSHYIIPNPSENVVDVMPIEYTAKVEQFRIF